VSRARLSALVALVIFGAGLAAGVALNRRLTRPVVPSSVITHGTTTTATLPTPALQPKDVVKLVTNPADAAALVASQHEVAALTETIAELRAHGSGPVQYIDRPVPGPAGQTVVDHEVHFSDGRLRFDSSSQAGSATYSLTQRIEAQAVFGRDDQGKWTAAVQVFDLWPGDTPTRLTNVKTTVVVADPAASRWRVGVALQAGVGGGVTTARTGQAGAIIAMPWLRRGSSSAAEDNRLALLTPAAFISADAVDPAILPVSISLRLGPVRDLWLSPVLAAHVTPAGATGFRLGAALTATF
jgi:hypothetical protein